MINRRIFAALSAVALMGSAAQAQTLPTHRIPAALAVEAASETVAACAKQGYHETAQVVDADGVIIATMRGDGSAPTRSIALSPKPIPPPRSRTTRLRSPSEPRARIRFAPLAKLPHVMFFGGGVPIKLGDEIIGAIGAAGAPGGKLDDACARAGLDKIKDRLQ